MVTGNPGQVGISDKDILDYQIQAWKQSIEVQQHFNTLEMQIRNLAITVLAGVIAAAAAIYKVNAVLPAKLILSTGILVWVAFFLMDRYWYHKLLIGLVISAKKIEDIIAKTLPGITLSHDIGEASPIIIIKGTKGIHTDLKIFIFYGLIFLVVLGLVIFI